MQSITYLYCDQCGWYTDTTDAGMKMQCHDCGNVALNFLSDTSRKAIIDRLYEIQVDVGCRLMRNVYMLNKDLVFHADVEEVEKLPYLDAKKIEKEFRKRRAENLVEFLRKELMPTAYDGPTVSG